MTKDIWVDFENREVYTYEYEVKDLVEDYKHSKHFNYDEEFDDYLHECYDMIQVFRFTDNEKKEIEQEFNKSIYDEIVDRLDIQHFEITL